MHRRKLQVQLSNVGGSDPDSFEPWKGTWNVFKSFKDKLPHSIILCHIVVTCFCISVK